MQEYSDSTAAAIASDKGLEAAIRARSGSTQAKLVKSENASPAPTSVTADKNIK